MKRIAALLFIAFLSACATTPTGTTTTPQQAVFLLRSDLNAALAVAVAYRSLPQCGQLAPPVCSKVEIAEKVRVAANGAAAAVLAAENTVRSPGIGVNPQGAVIAAQNALIALTAITSTLAIK